MAVTNPLGPKPSPVPDPPAEDFMSDAQWETLWALLDGFLPSVTSTSSSSVRDWNGSITLSDSEFEELVDECASALSHPPSRERIRDYLESRPSLDAKFREDCLRSLALVPQRGKLAKVLNLLSGHAGSMLLTGHWQPVTAQPAHVRQAILQSWASSHLPALRLLAKSLAQMALKANSLHSRFFQEISGYSDVPSDWKKIEGYPYRFVQVPAGQDVYEMSTDVVIVGSGCGGGVSAKTIAEAGHRVLVVDKGYYFPPSLLPMTQEAASHHLYEGGGLLSSDSSSTSVVCGSSWGGGGTVNWSVCLRLQDFVRDEWAARGLPLFASGDFDESMDRVWDFVGASKSAIRHNARNQALLDGIKTLGWKGGVVEQNTAGREHYCGRCHLGCSSAEKRGPATSWLPAAGEAGAEFMEGFTVERVVFSDTDEGVATGVQGLWTARDDDGGVHRPASARTQRRVFVRAKKVIVAAGSLWSPVLLARSGVKNPNVGKHLHLHPTNFVSGVFGNTDMTSWEGGIITSCVDEFENLDGLGHGVKLEPTCNVPYTTYSLQTWRGGIDAKVLALKYRHLGSFIALTRDRDTGRVYADPRDGRPRIKYDMSDFDRQHALEGVIALAKICYVARATEIRPHLAGVGPFVARDGGTRQAEHQPGTDPEFTDADSAAWIARLRRAGNRPPAAMCVSAHQMGSCRMSAHEADGVVDMRGRVWGTRGLYVADASVFPSASGVNPMVTAMALADWISRGVVADLEGA
ncbi:hypothetical protein E4U42_001643 [Claviceps africana]|uniref:Long-chain-alcohol oxidase n=1 Tax=Claviceps africana TaxID=83212 RepID=A0A8K0JFG5_9HYPO|nr:hypothetical protein E4U42_001643 [Claviceps africana]